MPDHNGKFFYGWYIVGIAFMANFMSVGTAFYAINAFMEPLCELRHWTRTDINMALVMGTLFGFLGQFIYGTLVIRVGSRILMILGSVVASFAFILLMRVEALWQFYMFYILLFMGSGAYGGIVASTTVNNWFQIKRGKALGFATAGISFSGAILPFLALLLILHSGIEGASLGIGLMILVIAPLAWLFVRDWPERYGMLPDGIKQDNKMNASELNSSSQDVLKMKRDGAALHEIIWTLPTILKTGTFWKLGISYSLAMIGTVGVMSQLKPRFSDIGFSDLTAMGMMAATAFMGGIGKYTWGMLCDRFEPRKIVTLLAVANAIGLGLALFRNSVPVLLLFIIIFGFTMGGILSTYPIIVADMFGRESFAAVLRFVSLFLVLQLLGYIIAGQSFDRLGSYDPAYILFIVLDLVAACLFFSLKRPVKPGN